MSSRRAFITLLGGAAWPLVARAQQAGKAPNYGHLGRRRIRLDRWDRCFRPASGAQPVES